MMNLWGSNTTACFWMCQEVISEALWQKAVYRASPVLGLTALLSDVESFQVHVLGEGQFGPDHWQLSQARRLYYCLKPFLPRVLINFIKCLNAKTAKNRFPLHWPIEERYAQFQWEIIRQLMIEMEIASLNYRHFWPEGLRYAAILTHDIETKKGQAFAGFVADLEENLGFRSSFNFVPESYVLDRGLIHDLLERGFEVGIHGLKHDGKLYSSKKLFSRRAEKINDYLQEFNAVGFRSPLMQRNPEWLQELHIEYDLSFFDTDPYQPMPGGCMSIWPFFIGHFVELPYTLVQDCTACFVLGETTPRIWLEKLDFIEANCGMGLLNTHPDYLRNSKLWNLYVAFLNNLAERENYWHALPNEAASWWRERYETPSGQESPEMTDGTIFLEDGELVVYLAGLAVSNYYA